MLPLAVLFLLILIFFPIDSSRRELDLGDFEENMIWLACVWTVINQILSNLV